MLNRNKPIVLGSGTGASDGSGPGVGVPVADVTGPDVTGFVPPVVGVEAPKITGPPTETGLCGKLDAGVPRPSSGALAVPDLAGSIGG